MRSSPRSSSYRAVGPDQGHRARELIGGFPLPGGSLVPLRRGDGLRDRRRLRQRKSLGARSKPGGRCRSTWVAVRVALVHWATTVDPISPILRYDLCRHGLFFVRGDNVLVSLRAVSAACCWCWSTDSAGAGVLDGKVMSAGLDLTPCRAQSSHGYSLQWDAAAFRGPYAIVYGKALRRRQEHFADHLRGGLVAPTGSSCGYEDPRLANTRCGRGLAVPTMLRTPSDALKRWGAPTARCGRTVFLNTRLGLWCMAWVPAR